MQKISILFISILILSCNKKICEDSCCGENPETSYSTVTINGLNSEVMAYNDLTREIWEPDSSEQTYFDILTFRISTDYQSIAYCPRTAPLALPFISTAYACSPVEVITVKNKLTLIEVTSNNDYNDSLKAGADLQSLFLGQNGEKSMFEALSGRTHGSFDLLQAPQTESDHQFTVRLVYDDTLEYKTTFPLLKLSSKPFPTR